MIRTRVVVAAAAGLGVAGGCLVFVATSAAASGHQSSPTQDVVVATTHSVDESESGGVYTPVATATLGKGSWVISFHASIESEQGDHMRCEISAGDNVLARATAWVNWEVFEETVSSVAGVHLAEPTTVTLQCGHDSQLGGVPTVDSGATLAAHRSGKLRLVYQ
jgi:co-chaperonin GroES (HSP10)